MKHLLILLLLIPGHISFAQVFSVRTITKNPDYNFPLVVSTQRPDIARKINSIIQTDLGTNPKLQDPFDSVNMEDEYFFETGAVNERVICLTMTGAHSGCGYHVTRNHYIFDSHTGAAIDMKKVFGTDGEVKLKKTLHKAWVESIKPHVNDEPFGEEYKNCLAEAQKGTDIYIDRMIVQDAGISFRAGYCLDATSSQVDQTTGPYDLSLGQLLPMLTPYGFSLFIDKPSGAVKTLLRGTIDGKYAISLTLLPGKTADAIGGMIVYDRVGQPINVSGTLQGNQFVFHELDESNNPISNIEVSWDGQKLTGSFVNLKTKKQMPFLASAVK